LKWVLIACGMDDLLAVVGFVGVVRISVLMLVCGSCLVIYTSEQFVAILVGMTWSGLRGLCGQVSKEFQTMPWNGLKTGTSLTMKVLGLGECLVLGGLCGVPWLLIVIQYCCGGYEWSGRASSEVWEKLVVRGGGFA
jgi:hypothetical protein